MNQLSYSQSLSINNLALFRSQLQSLINSLTETLSPQTLYSKKSTLATKKQLSVEEQISRIVLDLIKNEENYVVPDILEPLVASSKFKNERLSFYENRHGFSAQELLSSEYKNNSFLKRNKSPLERSLNLFHQQKRGFKTMRTMEKEDEQPGLINGLRRAYGRQREAFDWKSSNRSKLSDENIDSGSKLGSPKALNDEDKLKIAFAEGYLSRDVKSPKEKLAAKIRTAILWTIVGLLVFFTFFRTNDNPQGVNGSGVKFRVSLVGNNVNEVKPEEVDVKFSDVKGADEAKEELTDIVDYLRDPEKYTRIGAHLPKGVLLVGPPGTGKTLLARATAGEAGVAFFHANGSEFDEMFVGTGAKKIRQLFTAARARAPCVIFIDEIDSVGAKRTNSSVHPYANQTINQLLAEMDGFEKSGGVIVIAATNRPQSLDKALTRPGRFDVQVRVDPPSQEGRIELLELYLNKVKHAKDIDIKYIARHTVGFTGADIENLINQAALKAAQDDKSEVTMKYIEWAKDKILMGPEKKSKIPDQETNLITAYHEAGHSLVAYYEKNFHPLHKVTILPRGMTLGHTAYLPEKDVYNNTKASLMAEIDVCMGGRVAEEIMFGAEKVTTGASSDFQKATNIATAMVKQFGMSEKFNHRSFESDERAPLANQTNDELEREINKILHESYERVKNILKAHTHELKLLAEALIVHETLDATEIKTVIEGKKLIKQPPNKSQDGLKPSVVYPESSKALV